VIEEPLTPEQQSALDAIKRARGECPSAETLVDYESLDAAAREKHAAHDHISICSRCQLVLLHSAEPRAQAGSRLRWALPLAALLVLGVAVTMVFRSSTTLAPVQPETVRGAELQLLAPIGVVDTLTEFSWGSPIKADIYNVTVTRGSVQVWTGRTTSDRIVAPVGVFEPNVVYLWKVDALTGEGHVFTPRMTSPPQTFTLSRRR